MAQPTVYLDDSWVWAEGSKMKPDAQRFFEAYAESVHSGKFAHGSMTKWYSSTTEYRSETGKVFHSAQEMQVWMTSLFSSFEKVYHVPEYYLQLKSHGQNIKVHAGFRRQLWLKGNTSGDPDIDTPMAWVCEIGPADEQDGFLGLQFKKTTLYWDKTKTVKLLGNYLPSD